MTKVASFSVETRLRVAGDTEARPQNVEGKLGDLRLPEANSYKDQVKAVVELRRRKDHPGVGKTQDGRVEQSLHARAGPFCHRLVYLYYIQILFFSR